MKRYHNYALAILLLVLLIPAGCKSNDVLDNGAKTLESAKAVYIAAGKVMVKLQQDGDISVDQYNEARKVAMDYKEAYNVLATALFEYGMAVRDGVEDKGAYEKVMAAVKALAFNYETLVRALNEFGINVPMPSFFNFLTPRGE